MAVEELSKVSTKTGKIQFIHIDVEDENSIKNASEYVKNNFDHLHILINNAGLAYKGDSFDDKIASHTIQVNYTGTKHMCNYFMPLMRDGGRVVNVSSMAGTLSKYQEVLRNQFNDEKLTVDALDKLLESFVTAVKDNNYIEKGWTKSTYSASKAGMSTYTRILQRNEKKKRFSHLCLLPW